MIGYLKLGAAAAVLGLLVWLGFIVHGWKADAEQLAAVTLERDQARANAAAYLEAARTAAARAESAELQITDLAGASQKVRVVYREAIREDPNCAAWADQPVACPLGLQDAASTTSPSLP